VTPALWYSKVVLVRAAPACNPGILRWFLVLSTIILFCCAGLPRTTPQPAVPSSSASAAAEDQWRASNTSPDHAPAADFDSSKPDAPAPKFSAANFRGGSSSAESSSAAPAPLNAPVKPATAECYETSRQRKLWYGLMAAGHGTAAFDAWTTRRAIGGGYGTEGDPLQRPFANSGAIYATTQVVPTLMDYLGRRMMRSEHPTIRKFWWIPQAASAGTSLAAGIHNYRLVP